MPYGKGTYGSKLGRPPAKGVNKKKKPRKVAPSPKGAVRKAGRTVGKASRLEKSMAMKGAAKKRGNPKNKSIMNTPMKRIPGALVKKTKQKIKNVLKNSPNQNIKKTGKMIKTKGKRIIKRVARKAFGSSGAIAGATMGMTKKRKKLPPY